MNMAGEHNSCTYTGVIWLAGSASAEFFADIALCPMEMVKVKVQTSPAGTWPTDFGAALKQMAAQKATTGFPFGSVVPLWSRQIPYTMAKYAFIYLPSPHFFQLVFGIFCRFFFFERIVQLFYQHVFTKPKDTYSKGVYQNARSAQFIFSRVCRQSQHGSKQTYIFAPPSYRPSCQSRLPLAILRALFVPLFPIPPIRWCR